MMSFSGRAAIKKRLQDYFHGNQGAAIEITTGFRADGGSRSLARKWAGP